MKPDNLLIFRNQEVKLGDFGVSMKIPDDGKEGDTFDLKGLTKEYSLPELLQLF
jgi:serine/threonine protein kinase